MTLHFRCKWNGTLLALIRTNGNEKNQEPANFHLFKINVTLMFKCIFSAFLALTQWRESIMAVINVRTSDEHCQLISAPQHNLIWTVFWTQINNKKKKKCAKKTPHLFRRYFWSSAWNKNAFNFKRKQMKNQHSALYLWVCQPFGVSLFFFVPYFFCVFFVFIKTQPIWFCLVDRSYHHQIYFQEMYLKFCCL